jgi:U3 small nucleolar RNA-associated protein 14
MARPQKHRKSVKKNDKKLNFKDAVLNASKYINRNNNNQNDNDDDDAENSDIEFNDEELDSDDALGSDDDLDDYMVKNKNTNQNIKFNEYGEDEDGWQSVDEGELLTLSEMWDRDEKELKQQKQSTTKKSSSDQDIVFNDDDDDNSEDDSENNDDESKSESESESGSEDEEEEDDDPFDEMNLSDDDQNIQLNSVMKSLKSKKTDSTEKSKKILVNDKTTENEFSLPNLGDSLSFGDMLEHLDDENDDDINDHNNNNNNTNNELIDKERGDSLIRDIAKHNKQIEDLENQDLSDNEIFKMKNNENSAFAIPLPVNIQKRHERRAAYEIQKEQVNKWREIIAQNRDKEVLSFIPEKVQLDKNSAFKTDNDVAINTFESKLDEIIEQSNLESKKTEDLFENIETAKLSKAEMLKRTNELRLMRELMYRGMKDSKRLKKIKSKAYRRQLRKDKLKEKMLISQVNRQENNENSDDDQEDDSIYQHAKERMTLKHKNTSSWAKHMIKSGMSKDKSNRDEMEEMMRQGEKLKLKQLGKNENESSDDERNLSDLENDIENEQFVDDEKLAKVGKGVLAMDFMKNAQERERLIKLKEIEELKKFQSNENYDLGNEEETGVNVTLNSGRRMYTPSALVAAEESRKLDQQLLKELDEEDSKLLQNRLAVKERDSIRVVSNEKKKQKSSLKYADDDQDDDESNPWLVEDDSADENDETTNNNKAKSSTKLRIIDSSSSKLDKSEAKIAKKLSKRNSILKQDKKNDFNTASITIENRETLRIVDPKSQINNKTIKSDDEYESDGDDQDDNRMFKQVDLIKQAFAGDDVLVEEFEKEKKEVEEDEGDKQVNLSVPGWGAWAGEDEDEDDGWGIPKNKRRKIVKTIQGVVSKDKRMDKGKFNVIINEKVNKKNIKYQADKVPYPYKTWEEYERSLRVPIGKEWTTTKTHQKMVTPKVITKFGSVIDPLKAPFTE